MVTYCDLTSLLKYTYITQYNYVHIDCFSLSVLISIYHSIALFQRHRNIVLCTAGCESTKIAHSHSHAKMAEIVLFCPFLTIFKIVFIHPLIYLTISKYSFIHCFKILLVLSHPDMKGPKQKGAKLRNSLIYCQI